MSRNKRRSSFAGAKRQVDGARVCQACEGAGIQAQGGQRCRVCSGTGVADRGRPKPTQRRYYEKDDDDEY